MKTRRMIALACFLCFLAGCGGGPTPATTEPSETAAPVSDTLNLWCFEAGKADAFLLWNESGAVLIDTGESGFGKTILEKLSELGIERLDYLIVTHFDKDHVGGAKKLLSAIPVGTVLQSNCPKTGADAYEKYVAALAAAGIEASTVRQTLRFTLGDVRFTVDPPAAEHYETDASNNSSLIVSVTHGADSLLFCGDALFDSIRRLLGGSRKQRQNTVNFKNEVRRIHYEQQQKPYTRRCEVCGRTDTDYPNLEFRYCSRCAGYHCFCMDHINNHRHFTE